MLDFDTEREFISVWANTGFEGLIEKCKFYRNFI